MIKGSHMTNEQKKRCRDAHIGLPSPNKDKPMSDEQKEKIREKMLGRPSPKKGIPISEEQRKKQREKMLGRKDLPATRKKKSESHSGDRHPNYKDGKCCWDKRLHPYKSKYEVEELKRLTKARDNFRCVFCGKVAGLLDAHHVVPVDVGFESEICDDISNLITACRGCHQKIEPPASGALSKWKEFLPFAKTYLQQFGYRRLLLNKYCGGKT
jgi:5-methylcytosine-specific restriction endonuclease McrA